MAGFFSGLGSALQTGVGGVESLLQNPALQKLLPIAAGAAGAALTSPAGTGGRGQLGRALLGGLQGYEDVQKSQAQALALKERTQHNLLLDQKAKAAMQQAQAFATANHDLLTHMMKSPETAKILESQFGWKKPEDVPMTIDPRIMERVMTTVQAVPKEQAAEAEKRDVQAERERHDRELERISQEGKDIAAAAEASAAAARSESVAIRESEAAARKEDKATATEEKIAEGRRKEFESQLDKYKGAATTLVEKHKAADLDEPTAKAIADFHNKNVKAYFAREKKLGVDMTNVDPANYMIEPKANVGFGIGTPTFALVPAADVGAAEASDEEAAAAFAAKHMKPKTAEK